MSCVQLFTHRDTDRTHATYVMTLSVLCTSGEDAHVWDVLAREEQR